MQDRHGDRSERTVGRTEQTGAVGGGTISVELNVTIPPALRAVTSQRDVPTKTKWIAALGGGSQDLQCDFSGNPGRTHASSTYLTGIDSFGHRERVNHPAGRYQKNQDGICPW